MRFRTIPTHDWYAFCGDFSRRHAGALVNMNVKGPGVAPRDEVINQPLRGISEDRGAVVVHIGDGVHHLRLGHRVQHVDSIVLEQTEEGADAAVEIRSAEGDVALLKFRSPIITELLDPAVE
jgi:hypothetical protein